MVCSRPSASIRAGSQSSGSRRDAEEFSAIRESERKLRAAGNLAALELLYQNALKLARSEHNFHSEITFLTSLGNVRFLSYRYSEAIAGYLEAKRLAEQTGDSESLGFIDLNLSSFYQQIWDADSALAAAEQARVVAARTGPTFYQAQLFLMLARFYSSRGDPRAEGLYLASIEAARERGNLPYEAQGWDLLGELRLAHGDLERAERAIVEGFRLRILHYSSDLRFSYRRLGALRLAQALQSEPTVSLRESRLQEAKRLTLKALKASQGSNSVIDSRLALHQLGRIQEAQGQTEQAIQSYGAAVDQAALWWGTLPASDSSLTGANAALHRQVFDSFVETAAHRAIQTGDRRLAAESFLVEEFNRASSLRETEALASVWHSRLPPEYWQALSQLRDEDVREFRGGGEAKERERLRLKISEMETLAGLGFSLSKRENFRSLDSLSHFQEGLKQSELLLSIHLGPRESYLWAVSRGTFRIYELEAGDRIGERARKFRAAVSGGLKDSLAMARNSHGERRAGELYGPDLYGSELYETLFGQLSADEVARPAWLISVEGPLFEVPFAALVRVYGASGDGSKQGRSEYLVERNSVQMVPGALLLSRASDVPGGSGRPGESGRMVAVGDPVYNVADSRLTAFPDKPHFWSGPARFDPGWFDPGWFRWDRSRGPSSYETQLNRLVATGREVEASADAWTAQGSNRALLLTGTAATRKQFLEALVPVPAVVHLATHVLTPSQRPEQAFIGFAVDSGGRPELMATSDIAKLYVPRTLVVMSGCATAAGEPIEGAGLLGLTRAWLMAGASGTIATGWPVEDSAADLLPSFYRYWKTSSTAEALRRSQLDMIHAGDWRSAPSYWAAYQLTGGER